MKDNVVACPHGLHDKPQDMYDVLLVLPAITNNNCGGDQPKHGNITTQWLRIESNVKKHETHPIPKSLEYWAKKLFGLSCNII
jgi:hypothetical protein